MLLKLPTCGLYSRIFVTPVSKGDLSASACFIQLLLPEADVIACISQSTAKGSAYWSGWEPKWRPKIKSLLSRNYRNTCAFIRPLSTGYSDKAGSPAFALGAIGGSIVPQLKSGRNYRLRSFSRRPAAGAVNPKREARAANRLCMSDMETLPVEPGTRGLNRLSLNS
jgi:hypothetical protein